VYIAINFDPGRFNFSLVCSFERETLNSSRSTPFGIEVVSVNPRALKASSVPWVLQTIFQAFLRKYRKSFLGLSGKEWALYTTFLPNT
jgi:hypothetical protein